MNDDEIMTLVRAQRDRVPLTVPVERIVNRGRALRMRRRAPVATVGIAAVIGAGLAVDAIAPGQQSTDRATEHDNAQATVPVTVAAGHRAGRSSQQPAARLAAWTVTKHSDGDISITLRQLQDPSGLQSTLRTDGVPASVSFEQLNTSCRRYPAGAALLEQVFPSNRELPSPPPGKPHLSPATGSVAPPPSAVTPSATSTVVVINPSALPSNAGVQLAASATSVAVLLPRLVYADAACTGS